MNVVVITASPRKNGNSMALAESFCKGASEAGHTVFRFDAAFKKVGACLACGKCQCKDPCVQKDDFQELRDPLIAADVLVFAAPVYYFGLCAQLKLVLDRFYSANEHIKGKGKKAVLLATCADARSFATATPMFDGVVGYLGWQEAGRVLAGGVWAAGDVAKTDFPGQAYQLGKNL